VRATFTISATFEEFDRAAFRTNLATYLDVPAVSISLEFMVGSIIVLATVTYPTMMDATSASNSLISATPTSLSTVRGVTVANVTAPAVLQLFDAPSPPPRPYLPEYAIVSDKQMKFEVHGILMLIAWGLFAPLGLVVARYGKLAAALTAVKAMATDPAPPAPAEAAGHFESQNIFQSELGQTKSGQAGYTTRDDVVARNLGGSEGATWPDEHRGLYVSGCCSPRLIDALCLVKAHAVKESATRTTVNMVMDVVTDGGLKVQCLEPEAGGCTIESPQEIRQLRVRIPDWLAVSSEIRANAEFELVDRCLVFHSLPAGVCLEITFPLRDERLSETLSGDTYEVHWRGNTVVDLAAKWPRVLPRIPLYKHRAKVKETE
jgi:hypothetical protein